MKDLPRIPLVPDLEMFRTFTEAGRWLADLHVNYESAEPYEGVKIEGEDSRNYRVEQLKYGKIPGKTGNAGKDKSVIVYNGSIVIRNIPLEAQEYVVNRKSALDWLVERIGVSVDKDSGIVNDFNKFAEEKGEPEDCEEPPSHRLCFVQVGLHQAQGGAFPPVFSPAAPLWSFPLAEKQNGWFLFEGAIHFFCPGREKHSSERLCSGIRDSDYQFLEMRSSIIIMARARESLPKKSLMPMMSSTVVAL